VQYYSVTLRRMVPLPPKDQVFLDRLTYPEALPPRDLYEQPEKRLLAAVLEDALQALAGRWKAHGGSLYSRRERVLAKEEAIRWVQSHATRPWSFQFVCTELGLEPELLRGRLLAGSFTQPSRAYVRSHLPIT